MVVCAVNIKSALIFNRGRVCAEDAARDRVCVTLCFVDVAAHLVDNNTIV